VKFDAVMRSLLLHRASKVRMGSQFDPGWGLHITKYTLKKVQQYCNNRRKIKEL